MGNWRRVHIVGGMLAEEIDALREELDQAPKGGMFGRYSPDRWTDEQIKRFGPLSYTGGLCGIGNWPAPSINAVGNLAERDYGAEAVEHHLKRLAEVAPSLGVVVHCGGDYESDTCVASVVLFETMTRVCPPQVQTVADITAMQIENNVLRALIAPYTR